jgi:hypothetical protein
MPRRRLDLAQRQEVFATLCGLEDSGLPVPLARIRVKAHFGITGPQLLQLVEEGIAAGWPPLNDEEPAAAAQDASPASAGAPGGS